eukprot:m.1240298 g.1240298  ORF g.1240298 m.1240298 type:complete len:97 (+) comp24673_c1_seq62:1219-1509(+)
MAPHTDKTPFTLIPSDPTESIEYRIRDEWYRVKHVPNTYLVHFGDALQVWTNGAWNSNWHRIGLPVAGSGSRVSLPHFLIATWVKDAYIMQKPSPT